MVGHCSVHEATKEIRAGDRWDADSQKVTMSMCSNHMCQ